MHPIAKYLFALLALGMIAPTSYEVWRTARAARPYYEEHNAMREAQRQAAIHALDVEAHFRAPKEAEMERGTVLYQDGLAVAEVERGPLWDLANPEVTIASRTGKGVSSISVKDLQRMYQVPR